MSNHEIGLGRVIRADAVVVLLWFLALAPFGIARLYHAPWYWEVAACGVGSVFCCLALWALGQHKGWLRETYRLSKGHADLTIEFGNRSRLANLISAMFLVPLMAAIVVIPLFVLPKLASPIPQIALGALLLPWTLLLAMAARLSIYAATRVSEWIVMQRRMEKKQQRRNSR